MKGQINIKSLIGVLALILSIGACKTAFDDLTYNNGNCDFSRFVAIGSGHMSGYSDNALDYNVQINSIPALLAERFSMAGGTVFIQPLVKPGAGIGLDGNSKYGLQYLPDACTGELKIVAKPLYPHGDVSNYNWLGNSTRFNNVSVPGARIADLTRQTFGDPSPFLGNQLYSRFASNPSTSTMLGDASLVHPTFSAVWIGMEDIYNYACNGGDEATDTLMKPAVFSDYFSDLITQLTVQNSGAVVANIPSLNTIPFFTAIPWNGLVLDAAAAADLTLQYSTVDPSISFVAGNNPFVIADFTVPSGRRQIHSGEYVLLSTPADSLKCFKWGTIIPLPARYVINADEALKINNAVNGYNSVIASEALSKGIAVADVNTLFQSLSKGMVFNGVNYTTDYLKESAFSTDGFYLNQRGNALVANEFLKAINKTYLSNLPLIDVNSLPGLVFP